MSTKSTRGKTGYQRSQAGPAGGGQDLPEPGRTCRGGRQDDTGTPLFDPVFLVRYISTGITLCPGDLIATAREGR
ncbi:hypothetical protein ACFWDQ_38235 [Streptomyces sp. NPDC060053]|uniref:hypothetical protein n=1 Tax=Streptomyces sp. NPDC060053 TaxID=3347047 RepID=UPI00368C25F6